MTTTPAPAGTSYAADVVLPGGISVVARVYVPEGAVVYGVHGLSAVVQAGVDHMLGMVATPTSALDPWARCEERDSETLAGRRCLLADQHTGGHRYEP